MKDIQFNNIPAAQIGMGKFSWMKMGPPMGDLPPIMTRFTT
jgi:hypothetical protein